MAPPTPRNIFLGAEAPSPAPKNLHKIPGARILPPPDSPLLVGGGAAQKSKKRKKGRGDFKHDSLQVRGSRM
jgi:hypothetical protein